MEDFKPVLDALVRAGFHQLPDQNPADGQPFDFKITPYSLNTPLSFRFDNLAHFLAFLQKSGWPTTQTRELLTQSLVEMGIDPEQFFYVNFFEKGKAQEM